MVTVATIIGDVLEEGSEAARIFEGASAALGDVGIVPFQTGRLLAAELHVPADQAARARSALQSFLEREKTELLLILTEE